MEMTPDDLSALRRAVQSLEHPGLAARLTNMVGKPIELMGQALPAFASQAIATATSRGLEVALKVALRTMQESPYAGSQLLHKALATASGAVGGALLCLRASNYGFDDILDRSRIWLGARSFPTQKPRSHASGFCVGWTEPQLMLLSGYFAVRGMLAKTVTEAALHRRAGCLSARRSGSHRFIRSRISFCAVVTQRLPLGSSNYRSVRWGRRELRIHRTFSGDGQSHFTVGRLERHTAKSSQTGERIAQQHR
jgi:hypothetical protein